MPLDSTPDEPELHESTPLRSVVLEVEAFVGADGWDQSARLFSLVRTADLVRAEPALAERLAAQLDADPDGYTSIEQDGVPSDVPIEDVLLGLEWPEAVAGALVVVERIMLPPEAEETLPDDPGALLEAVAAHPARVEVRLLAAVTRAGERHSAVRARDPHDAPLLEGPDLVPGLIDLLAGTLG